MVLKVEFPVFVAQTAEEFHHFGVFSFALEQMKTHVFQIDDCSKNIGMAIKKTVEKHSTVKRHVEPQ